MPSPALTTLAFTCLASSVGAPLIGWRMMMTSVPIWSSVTPVSISVSPLATLDAPPTLIPPRMDELGCTIAPTIEDACENADVVMGLRIQRERQQKGLFPSVAEYCDHWEITPQRLALAKKNALVMHPGPMNRGVEIASSVADCGQSVITQQVESGVAVRMALLYMLTRRENV